MFLPFSACNICGETYKFSHLNARPYSLLQCGCKTKGGHPKRTNIKLQSVLKGTSFDTGGFFFDTLRCKSFFFFGFYGGVSERWHGA